MFTKFLQNLKESCIEIVRLTTATHELTSCEHKARFDSKIQTHLTKADSYPKWGGFNRLLASC